MSCTGARSGLVAPKVPTLVVDPANPTTTALVVSPTCEETEIERVASEEPGEYRIKANSLSIGAVLSVPSVQSLFVADNAITTFNTSGSTLKEVDLTNNQLTNLDNVLFPDTLKRLYLDFNPLTRIKAGQLPKSLSELLLRKAQISSLESFVFPSKLDRLYLSGNRQLKSLYGLNLPSSLSYFDCSDSAVTEIGGVSFPRTLQTMTLSGNVISTFDFRASDLLILKAMKLQVPTVSGLTCSDIRSQMTVFSETSSGCQFSDLDFADKYPALSVSDKSQSSSTTSSNTINSSTTSNTTPAPVSAGSASQSSNSTNQIIIGSLVLAAVVIGALIAFVFQRRRKAANVTDKETKGPNTQTKTVVSWDRAALNSMSQDLSSNGFFVNDVRNDPELIRYRLRPEEITFVAEIARGGFGIVYRATLSSKDVVVKQITPDKAESVVILRRFMDEIRLHSSLEHAKVVRFIGLSWTSLLDLSLIIEFMANGDLRSVLHTYKQKPRSRKRFSWFNDRPDPCCKSLLATDIIEAIVYLHSFPAPIIHRDLKTRNVLLSADYTAKIGDFGISRESIEETMTGGMGTTAWIAPEVLQGERYSEKADIYSFGILMCELDACDHPYSGNRSRDESLTDAKIAYLVSTASLKPKLHADCPDSIRRIILSCIEFDPAKRPTAVELHYTLRQAIQAELEWCFV